MSQATICARARARARAMGSLGEKRRLGMRLVEILDDSQRLDQHVAGRRYQRGDPHLRIHRAEFRTPVMAAVFHEVNGRGLVGYTLEIER